MSGLPPAPWHTGEDGAAIFDADCRRILDLGARRAHLAPIIAAAPKMLEALERIAAIATGSLPFSGLTIAETEQVLAEARSALPSLTKERKG